MSFQGNQGEIDPLVGIGHKIPGADDGAHVVQMTQIQIAQIVNNAVSQALTRQRQQFQTFTKFGVPAFEGDSCCCGCFAQIVSNAVSQALTHQRRQFQTFIKFGVPAFEGDSCYCCFSHSAHWLPTRKKLLFTVANPARGLLNRGIKRRVTFVQGFLRLVG